MALTLAEIRKHLKDKEEHTKQMIVGDGALFQHWNIDSGSEVKLRFLPDGNPDNPFFWFEKQMIKLTYHSTIENGKEKCKDVSVQVPCIEMWAGNVSKCPILAEVREWYKDPSLKEISSKYWKKRTFLMQGLIRSSTKKDECPENPIRRFLLNKQLHDIISAVFLDAEIMNLPTDYDRGLDFIIRKTSKGSFADYGTSSFSRRESPLTEDELESIEKFGLFRLEDFVPKKPSIQELAIIVEMFHASVNGEPYDYDSWGMHFKPFGMNSSNYAASDATNASSLSDQSVVENHAVTEVQNDKTVITEDSKSSTSEHSVTSTTSSRANDLIAKIKNRNKGEQLAVN